MTTVHFAGVNTERLAKVTEGCPVLVSFAQIKSAPAFWNKSLLPRLREGVYPSVILDSGAFTVISSGIEIDVHEYAAFAAEYADLFDVVVNLDSIAGDLEESGRNQATLEAAGLEVLPVFHQGEPTELLDELLARHPRIGIGLARRPGGRLARPAAENSAWIVSTLKRAHAAGVWVHGFALTRHAMVDGLELDSVDSTTWIAEKCGLKHWSAIADEQMVAEPVEGTHAIGGELVAWFTEMLSDDELFDLVIDSYIFGPEYRSPDGDLLVDDQTVERYARVLERDARGQARTVLRRYGAEAFAHKMADLMEAWMRKDSSDWDKISSDPTRNLVVEAA